MLISPEDSAFWDIWTLLLLLPPLLMPLLPEDSSTSILFRLAREERVALARLLEVARDTVTLEEGLGDSFSLQGGQKERVFNIVYI